MAMLPLLSHPCEVCLRKCVIQAQATGQSLTPLYRLAQARAEYRLAELTMCDWSQWAVWGLSWQQVSAWLPLADKYSERISQPSMSKHHYQGQCCSGQSFPVHSASSFPKQRKMITLPSWPESFCCAMNQHSKRSPHAEETLLFKSFLEPTQWVGDCPSAVCLVFPTTGRFDKGWSTATGPSQAADVTTIHPWESGIPGTDSLQHVSMQEHGMEMRKHHGNRKSSRALTGREKYIFSERKKKRKGNQPSGCFSIDVSTHKNTPNLDLGWNVLFTIDPQ